VIVEPEDYHVMVADEFLFLGPDGIALRAQGVGAVEMAVKDGLVSDDEFFPDAAARWSTSKVANMVVAMPVTGSSGSPALKVSMVSARHGTPTCCLIRSTTCLAVRAGGGAAVNGTEAMYARSNKLTRMEARLYTGAATPTPCTRFLP
jgi:hypothetical protein